MEESIVYENPSLGAACGSRPEVLAFYEDVLSKTPTEATFVIDEVVTLHGTSSNNRVSVTWLVWV